MKQSLESKNCVSSNVFAEILLKEGTNVLEALSNNLFMMSSMADTLSGKLSELSEANTNNNKHDDKSFDGIN